MRLAIALLVLALSCVTLPVFAQNDLYDNGPIDGSRDAWTINFGYVVSDSFTLTANSNMVNGLSFGSWIFPGDVLQTAEVSITSGEFGGTTYFDGVVSFAQSDCFGNIKGLYTCTETGSFEPVDLTAGTYWINLQNAIVSNGDPVYWDENSGMGCHSPGCPSSASQNQTGAIPSESFTIFGQSSNQTPEPSAIILFGSGVLGLGGVLRRRKRL